MRILIVAPHTDDGEVYCGGTISRFIEEGKDVFYVAFSSAEKSVSKEFPRDILKQEVKKAMKVLELPESNLILFKYEVRNFSCFRQSILEDMIRLERDIRSDLVFLPSTYDTHQDHQVISQEGFRAFKKISILGYEVPYNNYTFNAEAFVPFKKRHLMKKLKAVSCYISQKGKSQMSEEYIRSLAISRGVQIGVSYAEAFEVIRWIV